MALIKYFFLVAEFPGSSAQQRDEKRLSRFKRVSNLGSAGFICARLGLFCFDTSFTLYT